MSALPDGYFGAPAGTVHLEQSDCRDDTISTHMGIVVIRWNEKAPPVRKIEWGEYRVEHAQKLEEDHRQLIAMFQELDQAVREGKSKTALRMVLLGLSSYAQEHFAAEESVMEETAYPETESHVAEHRAFAVKVQEFTQASEIGDTGVSLEVVSYLGEWLHHHLSSTDRALGVHLHANIVH
jgi:hemerythrin